jgi:CBS domain containing-hemolysin-like protein
MSAGWEAVVWAVAFAMLVVASGLFSGMAAALLAIHRSRLRHSTSSERDERMARAVALFDNAHRVLAVSLAGSTLANVAALIALLLFFTSLSGAKGQPADWRTAALALAAGVPILLVLGEIVPRRLFRARADQIIVRLYWPLRWALTVLGPLARAGIWMARRVGRWSGKNDLPPGALAHVEPWQSLLEAAPPPAQSAHDEEAGERRMIHRIFDLQATRAREVMRPLVDLVVVHLPETVGAVRELARQSGYSRFPVYRDRMMALTGYLDIYDILAAEPPDDQPVEAHVREAFYVPETKRLDELLQEFLRGRHKVAIVVDEHGGCSGWITREDLLEEIVGEIRDEFDEATEPIRPLDSRTYLVSAAIHIDDLNESLRLHLPSDEFDTLAGFVYDMLGRIPQPGDSVEDNGVRYEVSEMDNRRIVAVRVTLSPSEEPFSPAE